MFMPWMTMSSGVFLTTAESIKGRFANLIKSNFLPLTSKKNAPNFAFVFDGGRDMMEKMA
jgi:hypothetical protein